MTPADLAPLAAQALRRLARDLDARAALMSRSPSALTAEVERADAAIRDSRVLAAGALERLAEAAAHPDRYRAQHDRMRLDKATAEDLRRWATAWDAFAAEVDP